MFEVLSLTSKIVFAPVWILWRLYGMLYWAFDIPPKVKTVLASAPARGPERGTAFEVVDSRPQESLLPHPGGLLKAGFASTVVLSVIFAAITFGLQSADTISTPHSVIIWSWASIVASIASIFAVRKVVARRAAKRTLFQKAAGKARSTVENAAAAAVKASHAAANIGVQASAAISAAFAHNRGQSTHGQSKADSYSAPHAGVAGRDPSIPHRDSVKPAIPVGFSKKVHSVCRSIQGGVSTAGSAAKRVAHAGCAGIKHAAATYQSKARTEPTSNT